MPCSADVERVFHDGRAAWARLVKAAKDLAPNAFPAGFASNLATMLKDAPALPSRLPRKGGLVVGQPLWHVPDLEYPNTSPAEAEAAVSQQYSHGLRRHFHLSSERWGFGLAARPDPAVAAWTGDEGVVPG